MILELWVILIIIGFTFLIVGQFMHADLFRILGVTIIFLMAFPMLSSNIDYQDGSTVTESGGDYTVSYSYSTYGNHTIGFFMAAISALAFTLIMVERRREADED